MKGKYPIGHIDDKLKSDNRFQILEGVNEMENQKEVRESILMLKGSKSCNKENENQREI